MPDAILTDRERFPLIDDLRYLNSLRQHQFAPRYNFKSGDRLNASMLALVKAYASTLTSTPAYWEYAPLWLDTFTAHAVAQVPFYRRRGAQSFKDIPCIQRPDIAAPWEFVPDDQSLDDLLVYYTAGTTERSIKVLSHPLTAASYLPALERALAFRGALLARGANSLAIAVICAQTSTLTYASLSTYLDGAGVVKINLNPDDWCSPDDRIQYLTALDPKLLSGDPYSLTRLMELNCRLTPSAVFTTALALTPALRREFEQYFKAPVIDGYSLTECRLISADAGDGMRLIRPDIYLETCDASGTILPQGSHGEIVITGGNNPMLPLLRYRTGDHGRIEKRGGAIYIRDFEGRSPVGYRCRDGNTVNTLDISRVLNAFPLARFSLHQSASLALSLRYTGPASKNDITKALSQCFGDIPITATEDDALELGQKWIRYTSAL